MGVRDTDERQLTQFCARCGGPLVPSEGTCSSCSGNSELRSSRVGRPNAQHSEPRLHFLGDKMLVAEDDGEGEYKPVTLLLIEMADISALQEGFSVGGIYRLIPSCVPSGNPEVREVRHGTEARRVVFQFYESQA